MTIAKSGFSKDTAENIIINAPVVYQNVTIDPAKPEDGFTAEKMLGATQGGVEINIQASIRKIEADGTYAMDVKGLNAFETGKAEMTATILSMTKEMITLAAHGTVDSKADITGFTKIDGRSVVADEDYIQNIAVVGMMNGSNRHVIFIFDNALVTSDLKIKMEDKSEGTVELTVQANATVDQVQAGELPWHIYFPDEVDNAVSVTGVTITSNVNTVVVGAEITITSKVSPDNASNPAVTYTSSDPTIATVNENTGIVSGVKVGNATITATTQDGNKTAAVDITVTA